MFKPILDRVLVRRIEQSSDATIVIPEAYRQSSKKCEVIAIGDFVVVGGQRIPLDELIHVGDIVLIGEYNAELVETDGEVLLLVRIQDVRGRETAKAAEASHGG